MWVIFEGLDKAGKTTLEWELLKATNFKHMIIDRGPAGYMTFDKLFNRGTENSDNDFIYYARKIIDSNDYMIVYCFVDKNVAKRRLEFHHETCPYDYDEAQKIYYENIRKCYGYEKVFELDTTNHSIEECVELIVEKLREVQQREL